MTQSIPDPTAKRETATKTSTNTPLAVSTTVMVATPPRTGSGLIALAPTNAYALSTIPPQGDQYYMKREPSTGANSPLLDSRHIKRERVAEPVPLTLSDVAEAAKSRRVDSVECAPDPEALRMNRYLFGKLLLCSDSCSLLHSSRVWFCF